MRYRIYDYFLGEYLPFETNYGEDLPEPEVGWHVLMTDAAGLTGERTAIGISPVDTAWEESKDLCKVRFEDGRVNCDIYLGDQASKGALIGLPVGTVSGAVVGQASRKAGIGIGIGAVLGLGGFLVGKAIKVWKVRYR